MTADILNERGLEKVQNGVTQFAWIGCDKYFEL